MPTRGNGDRVVCQHPHRVRRGRYSVVRSRPLLVYGRLASRERAPRRRTRRVANLWVAAIFVRGGGGGVHAPMSYAAQRWRLLAAIASCASAKAVLAGNQTLAAMSLSQRGAGQSQEH